MASPEVIVQSWTTVFAPGIADTSDASNGTNDVEATAGLSRQMEAEPQSTLLRRQGRAGPSAPTEEEQRTSGESSSLKNGQHEGKSLSSSARAWRPYLDWVIKLPATIFLPPPKKTPSPKYQHELEKIKPFELHQHVNGIPRFAALQDSSERFCLFRAFGPQAAQILLRKEIELSLLAEGIHKEEEKNETISSSRPRLETIGPESGLNTDRIRMEDEFETKLKDYYDLLIKYSDIKALRSVRLEDHQSLHNYMIRQRPICADEETFFYQRDDFIYAKSGFGVDSEHSSKLDEMVELFAARRPTTSIRSGLHRFLKDERERSKTKQNRNVHIFSHYRVAIVSKVIAASSAVAVILIPVLVLYLTSSLSPVLRAIVVILFVFVFLIAVSILGDWGAHELFLLMAAYAAILVALLANLSQGVESGSTSK